MSEIGMVASIADGGITKYAAQASKAGKYAARRYTTLPQVAEQTPDWKALATASKQGKYHIKYDA